MHPKPIERRVLKAMSNANKEFGLIEAGDRILVALSGGKDSYAMLWGLQKMQAAAPIKFDLVAYHLDQGQPGHQTAPIEGFMRASDLPYEIEAQDTYSKVIAGTPEGKIYCALCSRFRRAILYKAATRLGCNKVAVGHHRDDAIETLLLNIFFAGSIKSMPPRLISQDGKQVLIRPMIYTREEDLLDLSNAHEFPVVPCNLCGSLNTERVFVKQLIKDLAERNRHVKGNIMHSLANIRTTHVLDTAINPLFGAGIGGAPAVDLDDDDPCATEAPSLGHAALNLLQDSPL